MRVGRVFVLVLGLLGLLALPPRVSAETYTLGFIPTQNAPAGGEGSTMTVSSTSVGTVSVSSGMRTTMAIIVDRNPIKPEKKQAVVEVEVSNGPPDTVYTIWVVFNNLNETAWATAIAAGSIGVPSIPATSRPAFPKEGNGVSPLARLDAAFTSGMGLDPGASFVTDRNGNAKVKFPLDYDLLTEAPVSNKDLIAQCVPGPLASDGKCYAPSKLLRITTTWLRKFIADYPLSDRAAMCANYDPRFDKESPTYDPVASRGMDARLWQCVDPATVNTQTGVGLPRVHRYVFDHFRLANHPDDLTHGFIGGNATDHRIDMVGRRSDLRLVR